MSQHRHRMNHFTTRNNLCTLICTLPKGFSVLPQTVGRLLVGLALVFGFMSVNPNPAAAFEISLFEAKAPVTFDAGVAAYNLGDYKKALKVFHEIETQYYQTGHTDGKTTLADVYYYQGICYAQLRDYLSAQNYYSRVVASFPSSPAAELAKKGLEYLPHLKAFTEQSSANPNLPHLSPYTASPQSSDPETGKSFDTRYSGNPAVAPTQPNTRALPPLVGPNEGPEPLTPSVLPSNGLSPQEIQALQQLIREYQNGQFSRPAEPSGHRMASPAYKAAVTPTTQSQTPGPGIDPAMLMMMQAMMGGNNAGYNTGMNTMMNPMMNSMAAMPGQAGGSAGAAIDPNLFSQMMLNQMMGSFDFSGSDNNK